jgi:hypothetical protein
MEHDHLVAMLNRLKMTAIRDQLDSLVDEAARRELTIREVLSLFCEREIARKDERRIEMSVGLARFPFVRDVDGFDFVAQPSTPREQVKVDRPEMKPGQWRRQQVGALRLRENHPATRSYYLLFALGLIHRRFGYGDDEFEGDRRAALMILHRDLAVHCSQGRCPVPPFVDRKENCVWKARASPLEIYAEDEGSKPPSRVDANDRPSKEYYDPNAHQ